MEGLIFGILRYLYRSLGRRKKTFACRLTGHSSLCDMDVASKFSNPIVT